MKQSMKKYRLTQKPNGSLRKNCLGHMEDDAPWNMASCIKASMSLITSKFLTTLRETHFFHKRIKDTLFFTPTDSSLRFLDYSVKFTLLFQKMQENSSQKKITTINFTFLLKANILTVSNIMQLRSLYRQCGSSKRKVIIPLQQEQQDQF